MPRPPSPCIDVCKFKLKGHCIGCGMTRDQKRAAKSMGGAQRVAFLATLLAQQQTLGGKFRGWVPAYARKCAAKGVACPLDAETAEA